MDDIDLKQFPQFEGFDAHVARVMADWHVNGSAIAVVKGGEVIFSKGYGWRDAERRLPVDQHSLFAIGSASKAFTSTGLGILVDRGLLGWDQPVHELLPGFALMDEFASKRITPRDLLCHRSGLPGHNMMWFGSPADRATLVDRLAYIQPNRDFRTTFQYQNMMFVTAGLLIEKLTGQTWEDFTRKEIFEPLGMHSSNFSVAVSAAGDNAAMPYRLENGSVVRIPFANIDAVGPAGSINSNLVDMVQWVKLQLEHGEVDGRRVVSSENMAHIHAPTMPIPDDYFGPVGRYPDLCFESYGLGWFVQHYRGRRLIHHGGHIDGFAALISFMPEIDTGVVFLSNDNRTFYVLPLPLNVYDLLLGEEMQPWSERVLGALDEGAALQMQARAQTGAGQVEGAAPTHPLSAYTGAYRHPGYGDLEVLLQEGGLAVDFNGQVFPLAHFHYDVFSGTYEEEGVAKWVRIQFQYDLDGRIQAVDVPFEPAVAPVRFRRV